MSSFQNVPPDLSICTFVLEQSLSVRALQEMLANTEERAEGVSASADTTRAQCLLRDRRHESNPETAHPQKLPGD